MCVCVEMCTSSIYMRAHVGTRAQTKTNKYASEIIVSDKGLIINQERDCIVAWAPVFFCLDDDL